MSAKALPLHRRRATVMVATTMLLARAIPAGMCSPSEPAGSGASRYLVAGLFLLAVVAMMRRPITGPGVTGCRWWCCRWSASACSRPCWGLAMAHAAVRRLDRDDHDDRFSAILAWFGGRRLPILGWTGSPSAAWWWWSTTRSAPGPCRRAASTASAGWSPPLPGRFGVERGAPS